jgi:hypothetical protein
MTAVSDRYAWQNRSACRGSNLPAFVAHKRPTRRALEAARAYCDHCPVRVECGDEALEDPEFTVGVWGGQYLGGGQYSQARRNAVRALRLQSAGDTHLAAGTPPPLAARKA